jgi:type IV pilus biogenesis protein PilP
VDLGTPANVARNEEKAQPVVHGGQADPAPAPSENSNSRATVFDTIDHINTDNALLNARIAHARLEKTLADVRAGRDPNSPQAQSAPFGGVPSAGVPATVAAAAATGTRGAYVEQVTTSPLVNSGAPTADVVLASGGHFSAKVGSRIPGVGVVESVSIHSVMVNDGKKSFALPFGGDDASAPGGH